MHAQRPGLIEDDGGGFDPRAGFGLDSLLVNDSRTWDGELLKQVKGDGDSTSKVYVANGTYDSGTNPDFASGAGTFTFNGPYMGDFLGSLDSTTKFGRFELRDYENRQLILDVDLRDVQFNDVVHVTGYRQNKDGSRVNIDAWFDFVQEAWVGGNSSDIIVGSVFTELGQVMQNAFPAFNPSTKKDPDGFQQIRLDDFLCAAAIGAAILFCFIFFFGPNICRFFRRLCLVRCAFSTNTTLRNIAAHICS